MVSNGTIFLVWFVFVSVGEAASFPLRARSGEGKLTASPTEEQRAFDSVCA
jgi:hypothetical protein